VDLAGKFDDLRQRREKVNALLRFCADAVKIALAARGTTL
jgi:hypothetical protein